MNCNERCIANVDGKCCVEKCEGAVFILKDTSNLTLEQRADMYECIKEIFRDDYPF